MVLWLMVVAYAYVFLLYDIPYGDWNASLLLVRESFPVVLAGSNFPTAMDELWNMVNDPARFQYKRGRDRKQQ